jgi:hypothetical protein
MVRIQYADLASVLAWLVRMRGLFVLSTLAASLCRFFPQLLACVQPVS